VNTCDVNGINKRRGLRRLAELTNGGTSATEPSASQMIPL
jgi:hypothetical protein